VPVFCVLRPNACRTIGAKSRKPAFAAHSLTRLSPPVRQRAGPSYETLERYGFLVRSTITARLASDRNTASSRSRNIGDESTLTRPDQDRTVASSLCINAICSSFVFMTL